MNWISQGLLAALLAVGTVHAGAADLTILTAGAFKQVLLDIVPAYEHDSGNHVVVRNDTAGALLKRIDAGEAFDLLVVPVSVMQTMAQTHRVEGSGVPLASVGIGIAVRAGAPEPDISTMAALKTALLSAPRIAYIDPASGGSSGFYVVRLLQRLGIADTMKYRSVLVNGGLVAEKVVDGSAELAIHQLSELMVVKGVTVVGPLPPELQSYTTYAGAVSKNAVNGQAAAEFLKRLAGPAAQQVLAQKGMVTPR